MLEDTTPESIWSRLSECVGAQMGLHYPRERWVDLERGVASAAAAFGMPNAEACARWLLSAPLSRSQIEILADRLTIGETYFFRDRNSFEALEKHVLPELIRARQGKERRLRVWSAGCCTGEEPYSIAMLLATMIPDLGSWNVSILATDIDPVFLRKASAGVYGEWSFRDPPQSIKEQFFSRTAEGRYALAPRIKSLVSFAHLNLARDPFPTLENGTNAMDLVMCRNVLMYFEPARARAVLHQLGGSLADGGWLLVSPAEIPQVSLPELVPVNFPGAIVHRKDADGRTKPAPPAAAWLAPAPEVRRTPYVRTAPEPARNRAPLPAPPPEPSHGEGAAMARLARSYANQGQLAEASDCCAKAIALDKLNPQWCYLQAIILEERGLADDATAALRRALYLDPDHALAHFALGNLSRRSGGFEDARRHYRNALAALSRYQPADLLPESEGVSAGRLAEIIRATISGAAGA